MPFVIDEKQEKQIIAVLEADPDSLTEREVRKASQANQLEHQRADARYTRLRDTRSSVLLTASDDEARAHDEEMQAAERHRDRCKARQDRIRQLSRRIQQEERARAAHAAAAELPELLAEFRRLEAETEAARARLADRLDATSRASGVYPEIPDHVRSALAELFGRQRLPSKGLKNTPFVGSDVQVVTGTR